MLEMQEVELLGKGGFGRGVLLNQDKVVGNCDFGGKGSNKGGRDSLVEIHVTNQALEWRSVGHMSRIGWGHGKYISRNTEGGKGPLLSHTEKRCEQGGKKMTTKFRLEWFDLTKVKKVKKKSFLCYQTC